MNKVVMYRSIETTVYRVALPKIQNADSPYVLVDAWVPDDRRNAIPVLSEDWIAPGVYRARALVSRNRKTLAPFLASGLNEMDVTEVEL